MLNESRTNKVCSLVPSYLRINIRHADLTKYHICGIILINNDRFYSMAWNYCITNIPSLDIF